VSQPQEKPAESPQINLKEPGFAALLAWLVPGLGHWYQGRRAKAVLYFVCIVGLFVLGLALGSSNHQLRDDHGQVRGQIGYGRGVYFAWQKDDRNWAYFCQLGVGLPAMPALIQANRMANNRPVLWGGLMAPPRPANAREDDKNFGQPTAHEIHRYLNRRFELAWVFSTIAGLLNVLAIYDAFAGPVPVPVDDKKKKRKESLETAAQTSA
jgi:hypothetical protein